MMLKNFKNKLIILFITALIIAGIVNYVNYLINKPLKILDNPYIPTEFIYNNQKIALAWTDDNEGENLIIQSDKKEYSGFNTVDVYFSITNISNKDQEADIVIWLPSEKTKVEKVERINEDGFNFQFSISNFQSISNDQFSNRKDIKGSTASYAVKDSIESGETNFYKATIKYPTLSKGEFFIEAFSAQGGYGHLDPWYSSSWSYKRAITLQGSKIATTTDGFPILATTTLADLKTTTNGGKVGNDNGYDIIFVDSDDSTLLNYEREKYASTTGEIAYWIKTNIASSTDKTIYMYYGNASASDTATTTGVWDSNFVMVQHLQETDIDGGAGDIKDSTKYANNGTTYTMNATDQVAGQIDGSFDFDGTDDYVGLPTNDGAGTVLGQTNSTFTSGTISLWFNATTISTSNRELFSASDSGDILSLLGLHILTTSKIQFYIWEALSGQLQFSVNDTISLTTWYHVVVTVNGSGNIIYVNGQPKAVTYSTGDSTTQKFFNTVNNIDFAAVGIRKTNGGLLNKFSGLIDEARISNTARTAGWITTEYNNQSDAGSFMTIGAEVSSWPAVTTNAVTKIASTIATANGNITSIGSGIVTERGFKYGLTETDTWSVSETGSFGANVFKLAIPNLTPGTTYYIRAFATNSEGTGYGDYVSFTAETAQKGSPIILKENVILKENMIFR